MLSRFYFKLPVPRNCSTHSPQTQNAKIPRIASQTYSVPSYKSRYKSELVIYLEYKIIITYYIFETDHKYIEHHTNLLAKTLPQRFRLLVAREMLLNLLPALEVTGVQFLARLLAPARHRHAQRGLEHEGHRAVRDALRSQCGPGRTLEACAIRAVRRHHRMQRRAARQEAGLFGLVAAVDQAHELGHAIACGN